MSTCSCIKKIITYGIFSLIITGCGAPFVPDNYLSPAIITGVQKVNGKWKQPRVIPISVDMLETAEGQKLLRPALEPAPYKIGPFDGLDIIVWGHPEVSTIPTTSLPMPGASPSAAALSSLSIAATNNPPTVVQTDGTIFYPYVGRLHIAGMTVSEAQVAITKRLSVYIRSPQVTVQVTKYRNMNVYILGEVRSPGNKAITDKPLTLLQAISDSGGINPGSADPTHIYIVRGAYQEPIIYYFNAQSAQAMLIAEKFPLQENDIVYVSAAALNTWNTFMTTVLGNYTTYINVKGMVNAAN